MKIASLSFSAPSRYALDDEDLLAGIADVKALALQRTHGLELLKDYTIAPGREYTTKYSKNPDEFVEVSRRSYTATVTFDQAEDLTKKLFDAEKQTLRVLDLGFDSYGVTPSGLTLFKRDWMLRESWKRSEKISGPKTTARIKFMCRDPDAVERQTLESLADVAYLPYVREDGLWETKTDSGSSADHYPDVELVRYFDGELTPDVEREISRFYDEVKQFVLDTRIIESHVYEHGDGSTRDQLYEMAKPAGSPTMRELIQASTATSQVQWYAPWLQLSHELPAGEPRKGLVWEDGQTALGDVRDTFNLTYLADRRDPPIVVVGTWAWTPEKD